MADAASPLDFFTGIVRLFPLPNLVLFPSVVQPLHIFEPRYRQLMADALAEDRLITMALLEQGGELAHDKRPAIHPIVCIGKVFKEEMLSDGRFNLMLHGMARARILEEIPVPKLYRVARAELLHALPVADVAVEAELRKQLGAAMHQWFEAQSGVQKQLQQLFKGSIDLGKLCDLFAFTLPLEPEIKQELLEEVDVGRRVRRLLGYLKNRKPPNGKDAARPFPPNFSTN